MTVLGIDYGATNVGIALANGWLAEPLTTVKTEKALQSIEQLIAKYKIDTMVVGNCPEGFREKLATLAVVYQVDETLSSHDARQFLFHASQKKRRASEHAAAAAVMLQDWLERESGAEPVNVG